jgi:hypothetical protein
LKLKEIENELSNQIDNWNARGGYSRRPLSFSKGARETLAHIISNIDKDPSPYWRMSNITTDSLQHHAILELPKILNLMYRKNKWSRLEVISSWEILHDISSALDKSCPLSKGI